MRSAKHLLRLLMVSAGLLTPLNAGCEDVLREASDFFHQVADDLDDLAQGWEDECRHDCCCHHRDFEEWLDNVLSDVEDCFD